MAQSKMTKEEQEESRERGKQLAQDALDRLGFNPKKFKGDEDLVGKVFGIIWDHEDLRAEAQEIAEIYHRGEKLGGLKSLAPSITYYVKMVLKENEIPHGKSYKIGRLENNGLAMTYQKLYFP